VNQEEDEISDIVFQQVVPVAEENPIKFSQPPQKPSGKIFQIEDDEENPNQDRIENATESIYKPKFDTSLGAAGFSSPLGGNPRSNLLDPMLESRTGLEYYNFLKQFGNLMNVMLDGRMDDSSLSMKFNRSLERINEKLESSDGMGTIFTSIIPPFLKSSSFCRTSSEIFSFERGRCIFLR
jgi:hypothetical protein